MTTDTNVLRTSAQMKPQPVDKTLDTHETMLHKHRVEELKCDACGAWPMPYPHVVIHVGNGLLSPRLCPQCAKDIWYSLKETLQTILPPEKRKP